MEEHISNIKLLDLDQLDIIMETSYEYANKKVKYNHTAKDKEAIAKSCQNEREKKKYNWPSCKFRKKFRPNGEPYKRQKNGALNIWNCKWCNRGFHLEYLSCKHEQPFCKDCNT